MAEFGHFHARHAHSLSLSNPAILPAVHPSREQILRSNLRHLPSAHALRQCSESGKAGGRAELPADQAGTSSSSCVEHDNWDSDSDAASDDQINPWTKVPAASYNDGAAENEDNVCDRGKLASNQSSRNKEATTSERPSIRQQRKVRIKRQSYERGSRTCVSYSILFPVERKHAFRSRPTSNTTFAYHLEVPFTSERFQTESNCQACPKENWAR
jgi:hypothetical protein